jgi:serine/threonine protein kinase
VPSQHIVQLEKFFQDSENIYFLIEYCKNKTLKDLVDRRRQVLELEVAIILNNLVKGLRDLHGAGILHRSLNLSNIFISDDFRLKIGHLSQACHF